MYWRMAQPHVGIRWQKESNPLFHPRNPFKFFNRDSRGYSIGSCFAVNLNNWMSYQGFEILPVRWGLHYNTRTILYELRRAAGLDAPDFDWALTKTDGSTIYVDALRHCIDAESADELAAIKAQISGQSAAAFAAANCFLVTLGLSDIWEAEVDGELLTLNRAPYAQARPLRSGSDPFTVTNRFLSVEECLRDIGQIVDVIRRHKPAGTPIIITVSPVPLKHTSNSNHPHVANARSKATLVSAIHQFVDADDVQMPVSYFPAFEFFQSNPLGIELWQGDHRHPSTEAVTAVAEAFLGTYGETELPVKPGFAIPLFD